MSSNISIKKFCEFCGGAFTAKTLFTRYCSKKCNSRHYKQLAKEDKATILGAQLTEATTSSAKHLAAFNQDYLLLEEAAELMRVSRSTLYRLIEKKKLKIKKVMTRTVIRKKDIKFFFEQQ